MKKLNKAITELSVKTGVSENDVEKLLIELGIKKSLEEAELSIEKSKLENITSESLISGIKFGKVMVHM
ncbi:hypothetical protein KW497_21915 [Vibrio fluvialis]|nr:hypothetical protein [Vibrio fluvialis]MBY8126636.1 hypothetical protein [Vibrio fluvialis]MBY8144268.1 hypothetical protein [Vibrio fluvialis]MBY8173798.1 hypothetical protein [Vibrio fluvialis]HDM8036858.1 hypothetical protein [Vibrio fluvialis clinical-1]